MGYYNDLMPADPLSGNKSYGSITELDTAQKIPHFSSQEIMMLDNYNFYLFAVSEYEGFSVTLHIFNKDYTFTFPTGAAVSVTGAKPQEAIPDDLAAKFKALNVGDKVEFQLGNVQEIKGE